MSHDEAVKYVNRVSRRRQIFRTIRDLARDIVRVVIQGGDMKNIELEKQIAELKCEIKLNTEHAAKALEAYEALIKRGREREDRLKSALRTIVSDLARFAGPEGDPDHARAYDDAISKAQDIAGMVI